MYKIKVSTSFPDWPLIRQTPGSKGIWEDAQFFFNSEAGEYDAWIVYDDVLSTEETVCPKENIILITGEPPQLKNYLPDFLSQFSAVITSHANMSHPRRILYQQSLPWHVGRKQRNHHNVAFAKSYDELRTMMDIPKSRVLSVLVSAKNHTEGHAKRIEFVKRLKKYFGSEIDVYGRGINEIEDKWDAIAPYKYHIALENSLAEHYWTEKLSDVFLSETFPIYYGSPNVDEYFPAESYRTIDINDFGSAVHTIINTMNNDVYEKSIQSLKKAKLLVLEKYNLFPMVLNYINPDRSLKNNLNVVSPMSHFVRYSFTSRLKNKVFRLFS